MDLLSISISGCPINIATRSTLIFSFCISATAKVKPFLKSLDPNLQGATLIFFKKLDYFLGSAKNETRRGFTFAVALIQNEKVRAERVSILKGHPVY